MSSPQTPTTVNEAQAQLNAALMGLTAAFDAIITNPEFIVDAADLATELSVAIPSIIVDIVELVDCGVSLAADIAADA
jgi:hypothetical protein